MGTSLTIRPLEVADRAQWDRLWRGYLEFYKTALPHRVSDVTFGRLMKDSEPIHGLVAEVDNRVVGFAHYLLHRSTWSDVYCYLEDLFTLPTMRGAGIGRALIAEVEVAARNAAATRLYWVTESDNVAARGLYDQCAELTNFVQYRKSL